MSSDLSDDEQVASTHVAADRVSASRAKRSVADAVPRRPAKRRPPQCHGRDAAPHPTQARFLDMPIDLVRHHLLNFLGVRATVQFFKAVRIPKAYRKWKQLVEQSTLELRTFKRVITSVKPRESDPSRFVERIASAPVMTPKLASELLRACEVVFPFYKVQERASILAWRSFPQRVRESVQVLAVPTLATEDIEEHPFDNAHQTLEFARELARCRSAHDFPFRCFHVSLQLQCDADLMVTLVQHDSQVYFHPDAERRPADKLLESMDFSRRCLAVQPAIYPKLPTAHRLSRELLLLAVQCCSTAPTALEAVGDQTLLDDAEVARMALASNPVCIRLFSPRYRADKALVIQTLRRAHSREESVSILKSLSPQLLDDAEVLLVSLGCDYYTTIPSGIEECMSERLRNSIRSDRSLPACIQCTRTPSRLHVARRRYDVLLSRFRDHEPCILFETK